MSLSLEEYVAMLNKAQNKELAEYVVIDTQTGWDCS